MSHRIAIVSQKGGAGKTTVALNLALALAERGRQTLLVDLDPQGSVAHALGQSDAELQGIVEVLSGGLKPAEAVIPTHHPTLSLLGRGRLDAADGAEFERAIGTPGVLGGVLGGAEARFRYVLLDTPSGIGAIPRAALAAADFALVVVQAAPLSLRSLPRMLRAIEASAAIDNPSLRLLGVLPTMFERDHESSQTSMTSLWNHLPTLLDAVIPRAEVYVRATQEGVPLAFLEGPVSPEVRRFEALANELEGVIAELTTTEKRDAHGTRRRLL